MGNKEVLDVNGEPLFAELAYLTYLKNEGWEGVWINNWRKKFQNKMPFEQPDGTKIPDDKLEFLTKLWKKNKGRGGTWDIFAWKGEKVLFVELKGPKDKIRPNQIKWFLASLKVGIPLESFQIVEWSNLK
ncbi:VRR-NUC domain-containing protein [Candidatus Pacearchaeota archaeon]|nr:VRR-NUC domain-containing protein [Candidatus Pacearchaeota archaeon]